MAQGIACAAINSPTPAQNRLGGLQSGQGSSRPQGVTHPSTSGIGWNSSEATLLAGTWASPGPGLNSNSEIRPSQAAADARCIHYLRSDWLRVPRMPACPPGAKLSVVTV